MSWKKIGKVASFLSCFLAFAMILFLLSTIFSTALSASRVQGIAMDLDKVAGFSMQGAAADEIEFDELRYRESAKQPTAQEMKEILSEAQAGAEDWRSVRYPAPPLLSSDARYVYMTTRLPEEGYSGMGVFFKTTNESVRLWLDDELIYEYGPMEDGEYSQGVRWHLVLLPAGCEGKSLTFGLHSFSTSNLGRFTRLAVNDVRASVSELFFADLPFVFDLALIFLMSAIIIVYTFPLRRNRQAYAFLLLFLLSYTLWMLSVMNWRYVLLKSSDFWWFMQLSNVYLMAILLSLFLAGFLPVAKRRAMRLLAVPFVLLLIASIVGELFVARGSFFACMDFYYPLGFICTSLASMMLLREARRGNEYCRVALVPFLTIVPLGLFDGLWAQYHLFAWDTYVTPFAILSFVVFILGTIRMRIRDEVRSEAMKKSLLDEIMEARQKAQVDPLTQCFNRYKFNEVFPEWTKVAQGTDGNLALMILDIDFFKHVNDEYGHDEGDQVLRNFAEVLHTALDRRHLLVRWGGEEFVILCLHYTLEEAEIFANQLREKVAESPICNYRPIHCSIGVSYWRGAQQEASALLKCADEALYRAKQDGRNCVRVEQPEGLASEGEVKERTEGLPAH